MSGLPKLRWPAVAVASITATAIALRSRIIDPLRLKV